MRKESRNGCSLSWKSEAKEACSVEVGSPSLGRLVRFISPQPYYHGGHHVPAIPRTDSICLLDFRDKSVVWSWSDAGVARGQARRRDGGREVGVRDQPVRRHQVPQPPKNAAGMRRRSTRGGSLYSRSGKIKACGEETLRRVTPSLCSAVPTTYALMSTPPCSNGGAAASAATASSPCTARRTCSTFGRRHGRRSSDCQTISLFTLALHH